MIPHKKISDLINEGVFASAQQVQQYCEADPSLSLSQQLEAVNSKLLTFRAYLPWAISLLADAEKEYEEFLNIREKYLNDTEELKGKINKLDEEIDILKKFNPTNKDEIESLLKQREKDYQEWRQRGLFCFEKGPKEMAAKQTKVASTLQRLHLVVFAISFLDEKSELLLKEIASESMAAERMAAERAAAERMALEREDQPSPPVRRPPTLKIEEKETPPIVTTPFETSSVRVETSSASVAAPSNFTNSLPSSNSSTLMLVTFHRNVPPPGFAQSQGRQTQERQPHGTQGRQKTWQPAGNGNKRGMNGHTTKF